jgi:prepilin-type N-terminal cleavage/methylation domain-containing protein
MKTNLRQGFTLIEILIVVAIIAILASVVLVGLGPTQQSGRDARRLSDLREVQTGLELYYGKCGYYPGASAASGCPTSWTAATYAGLYGTNGQDGVLGMSGIGVSSVPTDPSANGKYYYATDANGDSYILEAKLENLNNSAFTNYQAPGTSNYTAGDTLNSCDKTKGYYCITL